VGEDLSELQERIGYQFAHHELLARAVRHASAAQGNVRSNERLEYLGDAVVGLVISDYLFRSFVDWSEGEMTQVKSAVVSRRTMARVGRRLGLSEYLSVDDGLKRRAAFTTAMVAGAYEAVVGAVFVDGGMEPASELVLRTLEPEVQRVLANRHVPDCKSLLQKLTQAEGNGIPGYSITQSVGPDHSRRFQAVVRIGGEVHGTGWGQTKRSAEQAAARVALDACYPGWRDPEQQDAPEA